MAWPRRLKSTLGSTVEYWLDKEFALIRSWNTYNGLEPLGYILWKIARSRRHQSRGLLLSRFLVTVLGRSAS